MSRASVSGVATAVDHRGLMARQQDMFDAGRRAVYLTPRGQELLADASRALTPVESQCRRCLGEEGFLALAQLPPRSATPVELALGVATQA